MDGVPTDLLEKYPELKVWNLALVHSGIPSRTLHAAALNSHQALHNRVAELPPVHKMYTDVTEGPRLAYKPLP